MKNLLIVITLFMFSSHLFSQDIAITGQVMDKESSELISYCTVMLTDNGVVKQFAITDEEGKFNIPIVPGAYKLVVRYLGYKTDSISLGIVNRNKSMGIVYLSADENLLDEIVIKENAKTALVDKDEVIVTKELRAGTSTVSDLLDKVNGVSYDRYNNQIKVDNQSNTLLLVNGLKKEESYIKNIDPDRIAKIEVIRDPSGRYGLEGYSSIVNVKLKKNYIGQEVFLSSQNLLDLDVVDKHYFVPQREINASYNYTRKALNLYTQFDFKKTGIAIMQSTYRNYADQRSITQTSKDGNENLFVDERYLALTLGADYELKEDHTLSFEGQYSGFPRKDVDMKHLVEHKQGELIVDQQDFRSSVSNSNMDLSGTFYYLGKLSESKKLDIDFTFGNNSSHNSSSYTYDALTEQNNKFDESTGYSKLNASWEQKLSPKLSFQMGYGNTWKKTDSRFLTLESQPDIEHQLTELRNRGFVYGSWKISEKMSLKTGLAIENSLPKLDDKRLSYTIYKPHLDLKYNALDWLSFKLKYRTREYYPSLSEANPLEVSLDNYSVQKGNPHLKPSTTHKITLRSIVMNGLASISMFYHQSDNYINQVGNLRADGKFEYSFDNLGGYNKKGLIVDFTIPFSKSLILQANATFYRSEMSYKSKKHSINDWMTDSKLLYVGSKSGLVAGLMLQKSNSKYITPQGYGQGENDWWGLLIQKPFLKKRLNVMALYFLPINYITDYSQTNYLETSQYIQRDVIDLSVLKNILILKVSYRFHKGKSINIIDKTIERESTKQKGGVF